jgi:fucose 4-O-acetylase-like acetyltransferase
MQVKHRVEFIDSLKGLAIFFVLWGHSVQYLNNGTDAFKNPIFEFIYSFHMPLFFFISGFFFKSSLKLNFKTFFLNKGLQLLLPCFVWSILFFIFNLGQCLFTEEYYFDWMQEFIKFINPLKWPFWFLKDLFLSYFIVYVFYKILKNEYIVFISSMLFVLILPSQFDEQRLLLPIFLGGILMKDNYQFVQNHLNYLVYSSGLLFLCCLFFWDGKYTMYVTNFSGIVNWMNLSLNSSDIEIYLFRLLIGFSGSIFFFVFYDKKYKNNWLNDKLKYVGIHTLSIYVLQATILENILNQQLNFPYVNIWVYSLLITPIVSLLVLFLCVSIYKLMSKNDFINFLLFGGSIKKFKRVCNN